MDEAKDILVVFSISDKKDALACLEKLREFDKNIHACVYVSKKNKELEPENSWITILEEDFDSKGIPTESICKKFTSIPADILIDLTRKNDYAMHYLLLKHPANFKVGNKSALKDMYDMTVSATDENEIDPLFDHILFYLLTIRSK
jgi:sulfur transfer complex TusBCD TusB component (DsrH family)